MGNVNGEKQWYIVTTYSGNEQKVKENIERRIESYNLQDYVFRVLVATQDIPEIDKATGKQKQVKDKETGEMKDKFKTINTYPGYVFVEMIMTDDSWYMIRNTPRVTGIAGSGGGGQKPVPVTGQEMERILKSMNLIDDSMYEKYHIGDNVKVIEGPFEGTSGIITNIEKDGGYVVLNALFFGRVTSLEVDFKSIVKE